MFIIFTSPNQTKPTMLETVGHVLLNKVILFGWREERNGRYLLIKKKRIQFCINIQNTESKS